MTGTPILNNMMDIYQQFRILDGGKSFGQNFFAFRKKFFEDRNTGMPKQRYFPDWQPKAGAFAKISELISMKSNHVKKEDCLDLPPLVKKRLSVDMFGDQLKAYKEMRDTFVAFLKSDHGETKRTAVAQMAMTKALRLQQIVSGFVMDDEGKAHRFKDNNRIHILKDTLEQLATGHKVIVWACFRENYKQIRDVCRVLKLDYAELHGDIKDKQTQLEKFTGNDKCRVMIANQAAGGIGVNMVEASYSIYYSRSFNLGDDLQSEARNYRGGSEIHDRVTRIDLVTAGTIDDRVLEALAAKKSIGDMILQMGDL